MERVGFWLFAALSVAPIWLAPWFPSQDGPVHLYVLQLWQHLDEPGFARQREFFVLNSALEPNLGFYLPAYLLSRFFDPATVEKLVVTATALLFCWGGRYAVRQVDASAAPLSWLFLPVALHRLVHMGFYNYAVGVALTLPAFGYFWRRWRTSGAALEAKDALAFAAICFALVIAHLTALVAFGLFVGGVLLGGLAVAKRPGQRMDVIRSGVVMAIAAVPAAAVALRFLLRHSEGEGLGPVDAPAATLLALLERASILFGTGLMGMFDDLELLFVVPLALATAALAAWALRHLLASRAVFEQGLPLLAAALLMAGVYLLPVADVKGVGLGDRIPLFLFAVVLMGCAARPWPPAALRVLRVVPIGCALLLVPLGAYRAVQYRRIGHDLKAYLDVGSAVAPGSTVLGVRFANGRTTLTGNRFVPATNPIRHAAARVATDRRAVDLSSSLMAPSVYGYFPITYRTAADPYANAPEIEHIPPRFDIARYEASAGQTVDYVLVWGAPRREAGGEAFLQQLGSRYEEVASRAYPDVRLYRRVPE